MARVVYDLLFFFIVIIIVLNLIFGVIIDTFADLRSEKQTKDEILRNSCFICGMDGHIKLHWTQDMGFFFIMLKRGRGVHVVGMLT